MASYDHKKIEKKWQKEWEKKKTYRTLTATEAKKKKQKPFYVLDMFPYPSGAGLHVGHPRGYIGSDVYARFKRMQGYNVLHPMGFDSFGLPAEQYAIQTGKHPGPFTDSLVKRYKEQLSILGFSYDWSREVSTHDPKYYKWTQWIFLQIYNSYFDEKKGKACPISELVKRFEKENKNWKKLSELEKEKILMDYRLAYEGYAEVNWCKELGTVLANDEIVDSPNGPVSERGGYPVEKKRMRQWFMRITAYGDRLISGLDGIDWSESIKEIQKNWIGKSEGSEIEFKIKNLNEKITVFTTRADTLFGVTYVVLAPESPLVFELLSHIENKKEVEKYIEESGKKTSEDRQSNKEKTGIKMKGIYAINPANDEEVPIFVADYVLANYGTGAVMAVPAHDERDFEFAKKYNLQMKAVIYPESITVQGNPLDPNFELLVKEEKEKYLKVEKCYIENGHLINSNQFNDLAPFQARKKITEFVGGKIVTKYKMRDAIFARQRYWGEPIPLMHQKDKEIKEVKKLPLLLPKVKSYLPSGTGESPLSKVKDWVKKGYETNTMPGWAGSSWYFLRYMDPKNSKEFASKKEIDYFKNVDLYVGGTEHATGHLLYSRFWNKVLFDLGYVKEDEPFKKLRNQGMILAEDGRKMSKRWGNVINPDDIVKTYGADTMRLYEMFMGPFSSSQPWNTDSIIGARRFIERVWNFASKKNYFQSPRKGVSQTFENTSSLAVRKILHKTIKKVTEDIEEMRFNTAISAMMIFVTEMEKENQIGKEDFKKFLQILAPFAPHVAEELWYILGEKKSINISGFPKYNPKYIVDDEIKIAVQVNGKVRAEITLPADVLDDTAFEKALENENVRKWLDGQKIIKKIYVKGRLVNFVAQNA